MGEFLLGRFLEVGDMAAVGVHGADDVLNDSVFAAGVECLKNNEQGSFVFGEESLLEIAHLLAQFFNLFQRFVLLIVAFVAGIEVAKADGIAWGNPEILDEAFAGHPWFPMEGVYSSRSGGGCFDRGGHWFDALGVDFCRKLERENNLRRQNW